MRTWREPPLSITCAPSEVHVWLVDLDEVRRHNAELIALLDEEERDRARGFVREQDRASFIAVHGALRALLGWYLATAPRCVRFVRGPYGKPALDVSAHPNALRFNMSHSARYALLAFANGREVGVDIEYERPMADMEGIARLFFTPREVAALLSLQPGPSRQRAFYMCWSRKEAFIKATGRGLSQGLAGFDVSAATDKDDLFLTVADNQSLDKTVTITNTPTILGYSTALAAEGHGWTASSWYLPQHIYDANSVASDDS